MFKFNLIRLIEEWSPANPGVLHFDLVSDPGHHSYKECLVSVLWCWEVQLGMHTPFQVLTPGRILTPLDAEMDDELMRHAARHKLERVASWRQIQGYSNQLKSLTLLFSRPVKTIQYFELPDTFNLEPVAPGEARATQSDAQEDVCYKVNIATRQRTRILPPGRIRVPLLTIGLDQGSIGSAGGAFMMFWLHLMVLLRFDKIHRLIRDLKKAENGCCGKIFTKAKLWSAYLYSLNKRPFGSGANATQKERWMETFEVMCDIFSPVFLKYLPKMAAQWKLPYGTTEEKQTIFDRALDMKSFRAHLSHPKVANWFAWNNSAYEQMDEFWASKMVKESQLPAQDDPESWRHSQFRWEPSVLFVICSLIRFT